MKHILILIFSLAICVAFSQESRFTKISDTSLSIDFKFENVTFSLKKIGDTEYQDFSSSFVLFEKDSPALPFYSKSIIIPATGNSNFSITYDEIIEYSSINILPSLGIQKRKDTVNTTYHFGIHYQKDAFYPGVLYKNSTPFILRELRGQTIQLFPYQYNPITKTLRFYKNLHLHVTFDKTPGINEIKEVSTSQLGELIYKDYFINTNKHSSKYVAKSEIGEMLVICPESYIETIQPFVDWKNQKGIKTTIETVEKIGNTAIEIKQFIQNYYTLNPGLLYLLLVGDAEDVPAYTYGNFSSDEFWSDSYYGQLSGNDYYNELFVGRFSGTTNDVKTMVDRTIDYEKTPSEGDWMTRAIGVASSQGLGIGDNGESDWQHVRNIKSSLLATDYTYVYEFYDGNQGELDAPNNPTSSEIVEALNSGVGLFNYTGHGDTQNFVTSNFESSDILTTTNYGKYPFVISVACNNGKFVKNTCLAETWLRSTNNNKTTGAIAVCGSTILMDWAPPMKTQDEMIRLLSNHDVSIRNTTLGAIFNNGQFSMLEKYGQNGENVVQTWLFFGDPSTVFRNNLTKSLDYSYNTCLECPISTELELNSSLDSIQVGISKNNSFIDFGVFKNKKFSYIFPSTIQKENYVFTLSKQNHSVEQFTITTDGKDGKLFIENLHKPKITIFPNPAASKLNIQNTSEFSLEIFSMDGKLLETIHHSGDAYLTIDVNNLISGNYLLKFTTNSTVFTEKVEIIH